MSAVLVTQPLGLWRRLRSFSPLGWVTKTAFILGPRQNSKLAVLSPENLVQLKTDLIYVSILCDDLNIKIILYI